MLLDDIGPVAVWDIETTGLSADGVQAASVVEIGGLLWGPDGEAGSFHTYVRPIVGAFVDPESMAVNGIDLASLDDAPLHRDAWRSFLEWADGRPLAGWNSHRFDERFLMRDTGMYRGDRRNPQMLDVKDLYSAYFRPDGPVSLSDACRRLNVPRTVDHTALGDARTTGLVLSALLKEMGL